MSATHDDVASRSCGRAKSERINRPATSVRGRVPFYRAISKEGADAAWASSTSDGAAGVTDRDGRAPGVASDLRRALRKRGPVQVVKRRSFVP